MVSATLKPLPGDNLHVNPKQEVRAALKVKAKIDLLAGKNTAGPTFARQQIWRRVSDANRRDKKDQKFLQLSNFSMSGLSSE